MEAKIKCTLIAISIIIVINNAAADAQQSSKLPTLKVSNNHRFLAQVKEDGTEIPFFYLGDTAWELFYRLNKEDADFYLEKRKSQGFNVIQAVALPILTNGLTLPNVNGYLPLKDLNPSTPDIREGEDNDYWDGIDYIVEKANSLGLYVALFPTWGYWWYGFEKYKPVFTPENAETYGEFIGARYKNSGIIWVLGGDSHIGNDTQRAIIRGMAKGLKKGDNGTHLITFHPIGGVESSSQFQNEDWLDFNMRQNAHAPIYNAYFPGTKADYDKTPIKPVIDGESLYEDLQLYLNNDCRTGHSVAADVRRPMYWDLFEGAFGHTYGHHSVWQFIDKRIPGQTFTPHPFMSWREGLEQPGGKQMIYGKNLIESRPFFTRIPDPSIIVTSNVPTAVPGSGIYRFASTRDEDGTYAMIYVPAGRKFSVRMNTIRNSEIKAWWYNPRNGESQEIGLFSNQGERSFISPNPGELLDWILVLDDNSKKYPAPGMPLESNNIVQKH